MQKEKVGQNKVHTAPLIQRLEINKIVSGPNDNSNFPSQQYPPESSFIIFENLKQLQ